MGIVVCVWCVDKVVGWLGCVCIGGVGIAVEVNGRRDVGVWYGLCHGKRGYVRCVGLRGLLEGFAPLF